MDLRTHALHIFQAGVNAADPYKAVTNCLDTQIPLKDWSKIHLIAFGKAAVRMATAALESIPVSQLADTGLAVTNLENAAILDRVEVITAGHPLPDVAGMIAAQKIARQLRLAKHGELVLVLVSGGGSALIPYPVATITLAEKIATTDLLLASGATIGQINRVRKHLSVLKGGGLVRLAAPASVIALILSDVIDNDLSTIASGTTVPDSSTFSDAIADLKSTAIWNKIPSKVREHLQLGEQGEIPETLKPGDAAFKHTRNLLIGSNALSLNAALQKAELLGYQTQIYSAQLTGEARLQAEIMAGFAKRLQDQAIKYPLAFLAGGETTVTVNGTGSGGRNQEMALAFAIAAQQQGLTGQWIFLSGGTDGRDGTTDAAGGVVDQESLQRMEVSGLVPTALLSNNDSYAALRGSGDLLITRATGTNVADLQLLLMLPL